MRRSTNAEKESVDPNPINVTDCSHLSSYVHVFYIYVMEVTWVYDEWELHLMHDPFFFVVVVFPSNTSQSDECTRFLSFYIPNTRKDFGLFHFFF